MTERTAIVTLALGASYAERWQRRCAPNWRAYAERHGYDIICLTESLDDSERGRSRTPAWQRCLIASQPFAEDYDRLVWVDADVLMSPSAPAITDGVPIDKVGAVDEYAAPTSELYGLALRKLYAHWDALGQPYVENLSARDYYAARGLSPGFDQVVQAGVMVISPVHHRELLERVYYDYEDRGPLLNHEMRPLSYELLAAGAVSFIDPRFNSIWAIHMAIHFPFLLNDPGHPHLQAATTRTLHDVYFLHFAGDDNGMEATSDEPPEPSRRAPAMRRPPGRGQLRTPVAMSIFSRPDTTAQVLEVVREVQPERLLVFADGPRDGIEGEAELCAETRALVERVDWPCEIATDFAAANLGPRRRIETGLDWVFENVGEAIILEDDCLPEPSFFPYCEELLERYRDDDDVFAISGDDFSFHPSPARQSYRFTRYPLIWGWATWERAWKRFDPALTEWPRLRAGGWLEGLLEDPLAAQFWAQRFDQVHAGEASWDFAWLFACWVHGGLTGVPDTNLVSNLGFRADATHTQMTERRSPFAALPTEPIGFPLTHPEVVARDHETDDFLENVMFSGNLRRVFSRLRDLERSRGIPA